MTVLIGVVSQLTQDSRPHGHEHPDLLSSRRGAGVRGLPLRGIRVLTRQV